MSALLKFTKYILQLLFSDVFKLMFNMTPFCFLSDMTYKKYKLFKEF